MRHYTLILLVAVLLPLLRSADASASLSGAAGKSAVNLTVATSSKAWWMGGRHIPMSLTVVNNGPGDIKFPRPETYTMPDSVIDLTVTDAHGRHADRLAGGIFRTGGIATDYVHLTSGRSYMIDLDKAGVCNEYETLPSGRYKLKFTLKYTDSSGHANATSTAVSNVEVRDVRDYAVSSIAVVTPSFGHTSKLVDPSSTARAAVIEAPGGAYWMAYWIERDPIATDSRAGSSGASLPIPNSDSSTRKWVSTLYWLGRVNKTSIFQVARKVDNDLIVSFTDVNGTKRSVEIDHFWAAPKYIKSPLEPVTSQPATIDL